MDDVFEYRVLFFCMGNICRSPTAHGVLRERLLARGLHQRVAVDSAGTHAYHVGEPPDPRSQYHAQRRGYDLSDLRARQLAPADSSLTPCKPLNATPCPLPAPWLASVCSNSAS